MSEEKITCKDVMHHICDTLGEDLDSPRCRAIKSHLETCDSCKKYRISVDNTVKFYKNYNVELSEESSENLLSFLGLTDTENKDCNDER